MAAALCNALECNPGLTDIDARLADLDIEGVEKELIFPQRLFGLFMFGKMMNRAARSSAPTTSTSPRSAPQGKGRLLSGDGAQLLGPERRPRRRSTAASSWARAA